MRTIITSIKGLSIPNVEVKGLSALPLYRREWVRNNMKKLMQIPTLPEKVSAIMMGNFDEKPIRQAFFMIRGRCYFLDFFFLSMMVAVEIDGSVHKYKKEHDRRRDADFRSIGIRTVRISNKDVMSGKLYEKLFKGFYK